MRGRWCSWSDTGKACYNTRGEESKALTIYKQLAVASPQNPYVFQTLFDLESKSGSKEEALNDLKRYAALKPDDASAQRTLGDMLYERKDGAVAPVAYRAALKADPKAKGFFKRYAELAPQIGVPAGKNPGALRRDLGQRGRRIDVPDTGVMCTALRGNATRPSRSTTNRLKSIRAIQSFSLRSPNASLKPDA